MTSDVIAPETPAPWWRRAVPFVVGGALIAYVLGRLDFGAFVAAVGSTHYVAFLGFTVVFNAALLAADALATTHIYRRIVAPVRYSELFVIRGASYLPSILNHHVGQAWLTYFVAKAYRAPLFRVAGATLLVYATTFGGLFSFLLVGLPFNRGSVPWLIPTVAFLALAGLAYLVAVRLRPRFLASRQMVAPLIEVGVRGHLIALLYRLPHVIVQFFGAWVPFLFFGIDVPLIDALALMPVIMFVVALPVSPQGLGTRDALALALLTGYATGTPEERASAIAATTLSWLCALTLVQLALSPWLMRKAYRLLEAARRDAPGR